MIWVWSMGKLAMVEVFEVGSKREVFEHGSSEGSWGGRGHGWISSIVLNEYIQQWSRAVKMEMTFKAASSGAEK